MAADFVESGYNLRHLIETIVTSKAYQLAAVPRTEDAGKAYVFRGPEVRRLTAEQFADAVSSVTGEWHVAAASANVLPQLGGAMICRARRWTGRISGRKHRRLLRSPRPRRP
jgi:hypothetical protein